MMAFTRAGRLEDVWPGEMRPVEVNGRRLLLVNVGGQLAAFTDRCAHLGVPLSQGRLDGRVLTCSAHRWQYDAGTGQGVNPATACMASWPVRVENGNILVDCAPSGTPEREPAARDAGAAPAAERWVGPVLAASPVGHAVAAAIEDLNPDMTVEDRGSYLRVSAPSPCLVTARAIEARLGRPFRLPQDLEAVMPSFQGFLHLTHERAEWSASRPA
jgi:toluene monooxygenase system ferredoxin subunit